MAANWDPTQYNCFSAARTRPARELIERIPLATARSIADLGCGDGAVTRLLTERWPEARVVGIDSSPAMLTNARITCPCASFIQADISEWIPNTPVDLLFSNAALQWVDDHARLIPRLFASVSPGGFLAVQMPGNFDAPSHRSLTALAQSAEWRTKVGHVVRVNPIGAPASYLNSLGETPTSFDAWETTDYLYLEGANPVLEWMKGTALRPYIDALAPEDALQFTAELASCLAIAYPPQPSGFTLFPFRRVYFVAARQK